MKGKRSQLLYATLLKLYARLERFALRLDHYLATKTPLMRWPMTRQILWWFFVWPMSEFGATGEPMILEQAEAYIRRAAAEGRIAVGPCGCRTVHRGCDHPLRTDIVVYEGATAWLRTFPDQWEAIEAEEAIAIVRHCHSQGMAQVLFRSGMGLNDERGFVICNCCQDGCLMLINRQNYPAYRYRHGRYRAEVDPELCQLCGLCEELCSFQARNMSGRPEVGDCYGCGLCASHCPHGAVRMVERRGVEQ